MNYIFDIEGTLIKEHAVPVELLPNVGEFFRQGDYERIGFASNQGGVGLRYWMEANGFGEPEKYPTADTALLRVLEVLHLLPRPVVIPRIYEAGFRLSYAYRTRKGEWAPQPEDRMDFDFWRRDWRKPAPGMLLDLIRNWGVLPQQATMVGDRPVDLAAALNAGCLFAWAHDFFEFEPEKVHLEPSLPEYWPKNQYKVIGEYPEDKLVELETFPVRYYRLANGPPNLEVIELDEAQFSGQDEKFRAAMDDLTENG